MDAKTLIAGKQREPGKPPSGPVVFHVRDYVPNGTLLEGFTSQPDVGVAVLCNVDGYLHCVVTDYSDGGNYDIMYDRVSMRVYGGFRVTESSFTKMLDVARSLFGTFHVER